MGVKGTIALDFILCSFFSQSGRNKKDRKKNTMSDVEATYYSMYSTINMYFECMNCGEVILMTMNAYDNLKVTPSTCLRLITWRPCLKFSQI